MTNDHAALRAEIYTPLTDAVEELHRRRKDNDLMRKVEDFMGMMMLEEFKARPRAAMSRPFFSPNWEVSTFWDISNMIEMDPLLLEYPGKFVAKNIDKYALCKLHFFNGFGKQLGAKQVIKTIVNFNLWEGKDMRKIKTVHNDLLGDFHHSFLLQAFPELKDRVMDITEWFDSAKIHTSHYYLLYLCHFICHGILFENFLFDEPHERDFFEHKILPSFVEACGIFGVRPLVSPLLPIENENHLLWLSYPDKLKETAEKLWNKGIMETN